MAITYEYYSEHSGDNIDAGVNRALGAVQSISINGVAQTKDNNGNVDLPKYPDTMAWGNLTGTLSSQTDLNTALGTKLDKNAGGANVGKFAIVDENGNYSPTTNPKVAAWGNIEGAIGNQTDLQNALATKVDKVNGKDLSDNNYNNTEKAQVAKIATIEGLIPTEATTSNKLADRDYVDNKVATNSGTYKGQFSTVADLPLTGNNNNDYAHVLLYSPQTGETIGYSRYKWSTAVVETNKWIKEYDNITNSFTPAQNAAIDSGVTAAKVTTYDGHVSNTNNPHNVTKAQIGLDNVVNTGDSATPTSGGTEKFTTGGAYTELNKKVDKTTTVGGVALSQNVTNQNLFDAIKNIVGTFTHKVIDGIDNTFTNIALSSLANQGGANAGKPIVVGNDGTVVVGDNVPTYLDLSSQIQENQYNTSHGIFNHCKFVLQNDMVFYNIDYELNNEVVDKQSQLRKVMELPLLSGQFSYPSKINVRLTQPICQPTSMEVKDAWYTSGGEAYVDPTVFQNLSFYYRMTLPILNVCYSDSERTKPIYIARQEASNGNFYFDNVGKPIVLFEPQRGESTIAINAQYDFDQLPYTEGTSTTIPSGYYHRTDTNKWYYNGVEITVAALASNTTHYYPKATAENLDKYYLYQTVNQVGPETEAYVLLKGIAGRNYYVLKRYETNVRTNGYNPVYDYYNQNGDHITLPTANNYWEVIKVNLTIDPDFLYKAYLLDQGCNVSSTGVYGKYHVEPSLWDQQIGPVSVNLNYPFSHGAFGTVTFEPKPITKESDVVTQGPVINGALYVPGGNSFYKLQIGAGGIM